jgi:hypothetical protein
MNEARKVDLVRAIDPVTVVVTPATKSDPLYGKDITVHVNDIVAPAKGQCGYAESLAFATKTLLAYKMYMLWYPIADNNEYLKSPSYRGALNGDTPYSLAMLVGGAWPT